MVGVRRRAVRCVWLFRGVWLGNEPSHAVFSGLLLVVRRLWSSRRDRARWRPCRRCGCPKPCRGWSGGFSIFVDQSAAACRSDNSKLLSVGVRRLRRRWGPLIERAVGPVSVVVVDVVDHEPLELALVPDDGAVKELAAQGADPAFGERVGHWDANRGAQDLGPFTFLWDEGGLRVRL